MRLVKAIVITTICLVAVPPSAILAQKSLSTGFLALDIQGGSPQTDYFFVALDDNIREARRVSRNDTLELKSGRSKITVFQKYYFDSVQYFYVNPNSVSEFIVTITPFTDLEKNKYESSFPIYVWNNDTFILTDKNTKIKFKEEQITGPLISTTAGSDKMKITAIAENGDVFRRQFDTNSELNVLKIYHKPERSISHRLAFIPGAAQFYKKEHIKGTIILSSFIGLSLSTIYFHSKYNSEYTEFKNIDRLYNSTLDPNKALVLGDLAEQRFSSSKRKATIRNYFLVSSALVYFTSLVDGYRKPSIGYREKGIEFDPYLNFDSDVPLLKIKITQRF